jgi:P27 family predicted phage terminase small subunit
MPKGRKKLPDAIKRINGTDQPCRMSGDIPIFKVIYDIPQPPDFLGETAKTIYNDVCKSLIDLGLANSANLSLIVSFSHLMGIHFDAEDAMSKKSRYIISKKSDGTIKGIPSPHHRVSMDALDRALRIASEFGITPSAQTKIMNLIKKPHEPNPFDEL